MPEQYVLTLDGIYYRMKALTEAADILAPAHAPEGRSHREGQRALYLSASPEGCVVATARYTDDATPGRGIFPLRVTNARVVDLRDDAATAALGIDTRHRAIEWQSLRAKGLHVADMGSGGSGACAGVGWYALCFAHRPAKDSPDAVSVE
ncbi:RES domain-containing protein [Yoonia sp. F2084L]|uniref:RES domain-containing protein n=1 Tax=Yoonia sp. F2084L TaxID=2926419 RepID=UPI001FF68FA9|nr:RES domain-containing protein [Yoonia sp. F2084L]MCK0095289.1 RES domain-containing protein [Yoonia sp. F2084L]